MLLKSLIAISVAFCGGIGVAAGTFAFMIIIRIMPRMIQKAKLEHKVFLLGYMSNPYPIIKQSAAVCLLSESEGFPTVFTEGMALGKPFISSPVGGTRELSDNGNCGIIINSYEEFK